MDTSELLDEPQDNGLGTVRKCLDLRVLGVRTTSGVNQLDFALVRYRQRSPRAPLCIKLLQSETAVLPSIRNPILNLLREAQNKPTLASRINIQIGQMFSDGIRTFCQKHDVDLKSIDFVGVHTPNLGRFYTPPILNADNHPFGWNTIIQANTGLTTVFGFALVERGVNRTHVSPVAFIDKLLLQHPIKFRACLNIDELANISFAPTDTGQSYRGTISHSCGPGTLLIDYAMRYCTSNEETDDVHGKFAAEGTINQEIVNRFLASYDYLRVVPPLNIAREMFGDHEAQRLIDECLYADMCEADTVATITRATAQNILVQYGRLLDMYFPSGAQVDELFICGMGATNANIIDYLESGLPDSVITRPLEDVGIPGDANEAVCYAHLALEGVLGQSTQTMGEEKKVPDEAIRSRMVCGEKWAELLMQLRTFSEGKPLNVTKDIQVVGETTPAVRGLESK